MNKSNPYNKFSIINLLYVKIIYIIFISFIYESELLQFLLKNMECNIEFLFNKYLMILINQRNEEEGEKHRHYELYKKYERLIEEYIEEFCKNNYNKPSDLILDIKDIINTETKEDIEKELELIKDDNNIISILELSADDIVTIIDDISSYTTFSTIMRNKYFIKNMSSDEESSSDDEFNSDLSSSSESSCDSRMSNELR